MNALKNQKYLMYNGSRVCILVAYRIEVIEKLHNIHQDVNALKRVVKSVT